MYAKLWCQRRFWPWWRLDITLRGQIHKAKICWNYFQLRKHWDNFLWFKTLYWSNLEWWSLALGWALCSWWSEEGFESRSFKNTWWFSSCLGCMWIRSYFGFNTGQKNVYLGSEFSRLNRTTAKRSENSSQSTRTVVFRASFMFSFRCTEFDSSFVERDTSCLWIQ